MSQKLRKEDENFLYLWIVLLVLRIWGTLRFVIAIQRNDNALNDTWIGQIDGVLQYIQGVGDSSMALCNFILFVLYDKPMRDGLLERIGLKS